MINTLQKYGKYSNFVPVHGNFFYICRKSFPMEDKKITIIDVAKKAGVSKGTVDRVLHNRGEVSRKSADKVRKAIEELGYEPNLYASLLATRKNRTIACILPSYTPGEYWSKIHKGFLDGSEDVSSLNINTVELYYDQYDPDSFVEVSQKLLDSRPDGVVIPPLFKKDTMSLVSQLHSLEIPYIYIDTKLEDSNYFAYFGMPMYKSGYLCASLLTYRCRPEDVKKVLIIRIKRDKTRQSDPTVTRRTGFIDYIESNYPECEIHSVFVDPSDPSSISKDLDAFFATNGEFKFVVMFNSRIHLIARYLKEHPVEGRTVIGFDDLEENLEALRNDAVNLLITQHTELQSRRAVNTLADYIIKRKSPAIRDCYMHMDILTKLNVDDYQ